MRNALPVAKKAGIKVPIACIDGAVLVSPETEKIVEGLELSEYEINLILSATKGKEVFVELNTGYIYYKFAEKEKEYHYDIFNKRHFNVFVKVFITSFKDYENSVKEIIDNYLVKR